MKKFILMKLLCYMNIIHTQILYGSQVMSWPTTNCVLIWNRSIERYYEINNFLNIVFKHIMSQYQLYVVIIIYLRRIIFGSIKLGNITNTKYLII